MPQQRKCNWLYRSACCVKEANDIERNMRALLRNPYATLLVLYTSLLVFTTTYMSTYENSWSVFRHASLPLPRTPGEASSPCGSDGTPCSQARLRKWACLKLIKQMLTTTSNLHSSAPTHPVGSHIGERRVQNTTKRLESACWE